ncbi:eye-specific diacylglycerol kinase isoform X1 [Trichogramma pretiosum]|uniref:eye-specific diacylglycerol kinase isoform X1 n=1 Tax=Trichogramma pretiosum TaxID=7493 RepID=UPI0006C9E075|nr:eye-specific diacylglycerol kinase isoform X1 [Trichogramma pretiosum]
MQRLRSTFKRSRTPTGNEMKSQSSLEVPKQVRSASFDEIQLEAQRQESSSSLSSSSATNAELRSIASIAMATSSSLAVSSALSSSSSATAAAAASSSSSSSWSNQYQGWGQQQQQQPPPSPTPTMTSSGQTSQSPLPSWSEHFAQLHGAGASAAAAASASTGTLLRRSANTLRPPPGGGQRSKSFDVASVGEHRHHHGHGSHGQGPSLLDRSASTTSSIAIDRAGGGSSPSHTGYGYSRWKSSAERDNPPAQAYSCWHCACVDEYRASLQQQQQQTHLTVGDSAWGDTDEPDNYSYDDDYYDNDADEECDSFSGGGGGGIGSSGELADFEPGPLQLERDASDNSYYFVVVRKAYEDSCLGSADDGSELGLEAGETSGGRREGSPEIRVTLTPSTSLPESEPGGAGGCGFESEEAIGGGGGGAFDLGPATSSGGSSAASRQRRRSLSRQEALELPILLQVAAAESSGPGDSSPDEDEQQASPREISTTPTTTTTTTTDQDDGSGGTPRERAASAENPAAGLVVRDIFLTVPDLKRDRAASVDSCFNNNKNGKIETCYSLQVPQQSPRSKSVDIVLPTDVQTRYTALLPEDARFLGEKDDGGAGAGQRELRSTPDWSSTSLNGEHLWVPTAASGEFCYINDCSKHGARLKCSACRVVVHTACTSALNFACKPSFRDVGVRQYREQKVTQHHWVHRRSQKGKCTNCAKSFQSKLSFSSKEIVAVGCSWCKQAYHNRESCFNAERIGEECRLGLHSSIMVPPSWIVKLPKRGAFKSSLRKSPKKKRGPKSKEAKGGEEEKEDPLKLWVVKPIPTSSVTPVLVFINPRSGGNQGAKLLQKFQWLLNPRQVFDLTQGGPKMGLELFKKVPNLRILACGGDGTVGWVLSVLDQIGANPAPAVGTLPLGTGNDLARALGWGGGYTDEPIGKILVSMAESEISILDRWQLLVERNPDASGQDEDAAKGKENLPLNVVNNYFSLGVDAHIALEFHEAREAHPERFNSRLRNKMFYGQMGGKDLVVRRWKDLSEYVTLECDGQDVTAKLKEHRVHAILFLNIDSYGGGTHPWGGGMGRPPTTEDGLIEVVGLTTYQLPLLQAGGHGTSIAQCSTAKLVTSKTIPMQVDGEACRLLPSIINMNLLNKATMLAKRRNQGKPRQKAAEVERLKLPLMKIRMHDYETFHSDKERLIKTAQTWQSEPLELDAGMDLESLRNQLSKTLPMDNCCFLDSCTAERFFRIDRAQEQLHYVADVVSEAIYILQEGPAGSSSSQAANNSQQQSQQSHGDNANMSREERRKMPSGERKSRGSDTNRHQSDNNNYDGGGGSYSARSRQGSNQAGGSRGSLTADQQREERRRPGASEGGAYYDGPSKLSSNKSHHSQSSHHFVQHTPGSAYISPRDRLFGLSSEVHTFSHELLERTSDGILKVAKSGDIVGLKDLHQRGYSLLSIDAQGQTALHLASAAGHKDIVRYLIACAPPIILNMVDNDKGQTALHKAAQQKKRSICCMLVAGGARLTVRDLAGNTPRELALAAEDHELAAYLQSQEQFQLMTEEGGYMS